VWWISYWHWGKRYRESTGLRGPRNAGAAQKILRAKIGDIAKGEFRPETRITVNQVLDDFEKDYRLRGGRQLRKLQSHLKPGSVQLWALSLYRTSQNAALTTISTPGWTP
jgi:hypothetical protein